MSQKLDYGRLALHQAQEKPMALCACVTMGKGRLCRPCDVCIAGMLGELGIV